jgi:murein L,D-transpeptidase YcbB/YkuD
MNPASQVIPFPIHALVRAVCATMLVALIAALAGCGGVSTSKQLARQDAKYALEVLDRAPEHGFAPGSFNVEAIHAALDRKDPAVSAMLRASVIDYARAQHGRLIPVGARPKAWGSPAPKYDAEADFEAAIQRRDLRDWLDNLPPPSPIYRALQQAYTQPQAGHATQQSRAAASILRANMERLRWLPRDEPVTRIDVNIASATMIYVVDGQPKLTMRTASGKPGDETPTLASKIDNIVLNPPWNVPDRIAAEELFPKGGAYLAEHGYVTKDDGRLMQQPGADSALGLVKFDFDNPYAVYLHDTPSKAAFNRSSRAVSHGCVRLERAMDLANLILSEQPGWSPQRIQDVIATGETTTVKLTKAVPVRLMYLTATPSPSGIAYLPDVYGWDAPLIALLDKHSVKGKRV